MMQIVVSDKSQRLPAANHFARERAVHVSEKSMCHIDACQADASVQLMRCTPRT